MGELGSTLQATEWEKEASTSCLGSTLELTLFVSHPEGVRGTELTLLHFPHRPYSAMGEEKDALHFLSLDICGRQESWSQGKESERTSPALHQL